MQVPVRIINKDRTRRNLTARNYTIIWQRVYSKVRTCIYTGRWGFIWRRCTVWTPRGAKVTHFLSYGRGCTGHEGWKWKGLTSNPEQGIYRPLYNLKDIHDRSNAPILVVEGEKTADSARDLFPEFMVTTWIGGVNGASKADWSPLKDRDVVIWPDNDAPGINAARVIEETLHTIGTNSVRSWIRARYPVYRTNGTLAMHCQRDWNRRM